MWYSYEESNVILESIKWDISYGDGEMLML